MAIQSQPSRISEPFAGSGTKNVIPATNATPSASQAASWASGFPPECSQPISAGGCPVPRNDFNGVLNWLSQGFAYSQDGGVWEWSALADYDLGRIVRGSDNTLYQSKAQSGPGIAAGAQDPTADAAHTYWRQLDFEQKVDLDGSNASSIGSVLSTYMAHAAMPSGQYEVLTLPVNLGNVTAAADGWLYLHGSTSNQAATVSLHSSDNRSVGSGQSYTGSGNVSLRAYIPVSKGTVVTVQYTTPSDTELVFIYANGSAPV